MTVRVSTGQKVAGSSARDMREMSEAPVIKAVTFAEVRRSARSPLGRRILLLGSSAMRTGFPQADARDDFERARRQARWVKLAGWLRGRPSSRNRLLVLGEV